MVTILDFKAEDEQELQQTNKQTNINAVKKSGGILS